MIRKHKSKRGTPRPRKRAGGGSGTFFQKHRVQLLAGLLIAVTLLVVVLGGYGIGREIGLWGGPSVGGEPENGAPNGELRRPVEMFEDNILPLLVLGVDNRPGAPGSRSDTIMLAFLDMNVPTVRLLSIPRDTRVQIPGYGYEKINHAHVYGGVELVKETVNQFLGTDLEYYVEVDFNGFARIVDLLGGVEMEVPRRMYYSPEGINLYPGVQVLDGNKALQFVRYRSDGGDLVRVERQQLFLKELARTALANRNLWTAARIAQATTEMVETDLRMTQILYLATSMLKMDVDSVRTNTIPGESKFQDGLWYVIVDREAAREMVEEFARPVPEPRPEEDDGADGAE